MKNNYSINIAEDLEYLLDTKFFQENKDKLFTIEEGDIDLFSESDSRTNKKPLVLNENVELTFDTINDNMFEDVFTLTTENVNKHNKINEENVVYMSDISMNANKSHKTSNSTDSTCSSRVSNTNSDKSNNENLNILLIKT